MADPSLYDFKSYAQYLAALYQTRKAACRSFTYRDLAAQLGITASLLTLIASGRRHTTPEALAKMADALGFDEDRRSYAELMIQRDRAVSGDERAAWDDKLVVYQRMRTDREQLDCFFDWHSLAILEMIALPDFSPDPVWIAQRLGGKIDAATAKSILARLELSGLIAVGEDGRWHSRAYLFVTPQDVPIAAVQSYHEQMLDLARLAVRQQTVDERFINGVTININPSKLPAAKAMLRKFIGELIQYFGESPATETYHLNLQLFRLTEPTGTSKGAQ